MVEIVKEQSLPEEVVTEKAQDLFRRFIITLGESRWLQKELMKNFLTSSYGLMPGKIKVEDENLKFNLDLKRNFAGDDLCIRAANKIMPDEEVRIIVIHKVGKDHGALSYKSFDEEGKPTVWYKDSVEAAEKIRDFLTRI